MEGIDVEAVRRTLPFRTGDAYTNQIKPQARETVQRVVGHPPTDVEAICCDHNGDRLIFIGLPGESSKPFLYSAAPTGPVRLPPELWDLQKQIETVQHAAVSAGRSEEDHSEGYALSKMIRTGERSNSGCAPTYCSMRKKCMPCWSRLRTI
jgi:hypothetical protein